MEFSRQEYWSGLPFPSPEDLPDPGIRPASPVSLALQADSLLTESPGKWASRASLVAQTVKNWPAVRETRVNRKKTSACCHCDFPRLSPIPSPGDLPNPGSEPGSPALQTDALPSSHQGIPY